MINILVTGVSRGLGLEIAKKILENPLTFIYGVSRTKTNELSEVLEKFPNRLKWMSFDLSNVNDIQDKIFKDFIGIDVNLHGYVNNAAIAYDDIVTNLNYDLLLNMYNINVFAPMAVTKYVIRNFLRVRTEGSIVHISSISVHTGYKGLSMYAASKGAIEAFSRNISREWGERKIRSNSVVAGFMETEMSSSLSNEMKDRIYKRNSLKVPTSISSVASLVIFLLSKESDSITGQNIHVDCGTI